MKTRRLVHPLPVQLPEQIVHGIEELVVFLKVGHLLGNNHQRRFQLARRSAVQSRDFRRQVEQQLVRCRRARNRQPDPLPTPHRPRKRTEVQPHHHVADPPGDLLANHLVARDLPPRIRCRRIRCRSFTSGALGRKLRGTVGGNAVWHRLGSSKNPGLGQSLPGRPTLRRDAPAQSPCQIQPHPPGGLPSKTHPARQPYFTTLVAIRYP